MSRIEIHEWSRTTALNWKQSSLYAAKKFLKERGATLRIKKHIVTDLYQNNWIQREYVDNNGTRFLLRIEEV